MIRVRHGALSPPPPPWFPPLFRAAVLVVMLSSPRCGVAVLVVMLSSPLWCGCGGGNGFIHPRGAAVVVAMVSSTPCGVAVVYSGFIHPLRCGCGLLRFQVMVVVMVIRLQVTRRPFSLWSCGLSSEFGGLHEGSCRVHCVCSWFITYYPTPLWFCGLWSGRCGLHEIYGLFIEGC